MIITYPSNPNKVFRRSSISLVHSETLIAFLIRQRPSQQSKMDLTPFVTIWGIMSLANKLITMLRKRARIKGHETSDMKFRIGNKRKRGYELCNLISQARVLEEQAQNLLSQDEEGFPRTKRQALISRKKVAIERCIDKMVAVEGRHRFFPSHSKHIPVNKLTGQVAAETEIELQLLVLDSDTMKIAIHGTEGIGKTAMMKHLYNYTLNLVEMFDRVFWITCPVEWSIKSLQDSVAMAVKCDLYGIDDTGLRARKLCEALTCYGRIVIFLDAVAEANFALELIGIPLSSNGCSCKLVITTRCPLASGLLNSYRNVEVKPLSEEEAFELFMIEAGMDSRKASHLNGFPKLLSNNCRGVPHMIVDTATSMCGINDVREWRHKVNLEIIHEALAGVPRIIHEV